MRNLTLLVLTFLLGLPSFARQEPAVCATRPGMWREERFLHRQSVRSRALRRSALGLKAAEAAAAPARAIGNIAVMDESDGVVSRRNLFNLDRRTVTLEPAAGGTRYAYLTGAASFDPAAVSSGSRLALQDDDSRLVSLPFPFVFYGVTYKDVYINSDGNLTFTEGDDAYTERSLGRVTAGPPRIAPLFNDLDPSRAVQGVRVLSEPGRFVVSWPQVPEWVESGSGSPQTFQVRLYPGGRIEFAYEGASPEEAIVGIAPGRLQNSVDLVSFTGDLSAEYAGAVAERFTARRELDTVTAAQRFYATYEDSYDFLVFFNNFPEPDVIEAAPGAVAWELTLRNTGSGFGDETVDVGREFGSRARLQSLMNMGPLSQYPDDPNLPVSRRASVGDTPLTILAHEAGHRFLAYASVRDPADPYLRPMLGFQGAHWFFGFNSEASLLEGNRIRDDGENASPRFETTATVEGFSPLDQYLMGLRGPHEVDVEHQMFWATGTPFGFAQMAPRKGVTFNGGRRNVLLDEIVRTVGRRTPDHTVAQRRFRFAFILVTPKGVEPSAAEVAKLETFRTAFEEFFARATGNRAAADTSLKLDLRLSIFPAIGVLSGRTAPARVSVDTPPAAPLTVELRTGTGAAEMPRTVAIPAGARSAEFTIKGIRAGVEEVLAVPDQAGYCVAAARVKVAEAGELEIVPVSSGPDPVLVRVTDINRLPYPGVRVDAAPSPGGAVDAAFAVTGEDGVAAFRWTPGASSHLQVTVEGSPANLRVAAGIRVASVVNAASFVSGLAPGSLATIFGGSLAAGALAASGPPLPDMLAGVQVLLNGVPAPLVYVSDAQINFLVPSSQPDGPVQLVVRNAAGNSAPIASRVWPAAPGIFFDSASGMGAILNANSPETTLQRPAPRGGHLEIYCTGLGPVSLGPDGLSRTTLQPQVVIGGVTAQVTYSGLAPGFPGLYQVNVRVPQAARSGLPLLQITVSGERSNEVRVGIE